MQLVTHCYHGTLAEFTEAQKSAEFDNEGLYLIILPNAGWTIFLGAKPLELYTPDQQ